MVRLGATSFPASVYNAPPESVSTAPALNVNLGGVNLSVGGGAGGTGLYRTASENTGITVQGADNIRDSVKSLFGRVRQGVNQIGLQ
jgi:vacuolar protein sorting-associated protein 45